MASGSLHQQYLESYMFFMIIQALFRPAQTLEDVARELNMDINCILAIQQARYLNSRPPVRKSGSPEARLPLQGGVC
ncbi:hypothetical protein P692DRAFT_20747305 [Suillus brevipes Sb2]|nr:hypothetical protein P692DRAFT_20747305 [Suillus brevipes Sb2]